MKKFLLILGIVLIVLAEGLIQNPFYKSTGINTAPAPINSLSLIIIIMAVVLLVLGIVLIILSFVSKSKPIGVKK